MTTANQNPTIDAVHRAAQPLTGGKDDYDALLDAINDARFVLLGEASHGTHEFYAARCAITARLIKEKGFTSVAVEADWPDAYRVNCYVRGETCPSEQTPDNGANDALQDFQRFPQWMWRNTVVLQFVSWLRAYNVEMPIGTVPAGFYGLDLYSMYTSAEEVVRYLEDVDPEAARRAKARYACFEEFKPDTQAYGFATTIGGEESCEEAVVRQLVELQKNAAGLAGRNGRVAADHYFYAEQNARLVKNAEEYYRSMFRGRASSWNLRDHHIVDMLDALVRHLDNTSGGETKVVVWAHNSHLGDARATEMSVRGEWNVGQLVRERHGREAFLLGFSTYEGEVTAADDWDGPGHRKRVRPGLQGSYEALFHEVTQNGAPDFWLNLREKNDAVRELGDPRLERAIGVIYRPETERWSHYFHATLPQQFDAVMHFDNTRAVEPLEPSNKWHHGEAVPETFPSGI